MPDVMTHDELVELLTKAVFSSHRPWCPGGTCMCEPADTHDRCCRGCANHQETLL